MKRILEIAAGVLILLGFFVGLLFVVFVPYEMWQKAGAEKWPARKAVVTMSSASLVRGGGVGRSSGADYWRADICGNYVDTGKRVCASRVRYGDFNLFRGEKNAREAAARYPKGREVDLHHSPDNPGQTVLEAVTPWTEMLVLLAVGIALLLVPVLLYAFRKWIDPKRYA